MSKHEEELIKTAKDASFVQDACNLCGVAQSFANAMKVVLQDCRENGKSMDEVNNHPITIAFVDKINSMVGEIDFPKYCKAMEQIEEMAGILSFSS